MWENGTMKFHVLTKGKVLESERAFKNYYKTLLYMAPQTTPLDRDLVGKQAGDRNTSV